MKWNFSIQNNGLMSKIKQPNKNWINDHNFNKDLTFKIMEKKKYRKTNVPFSCQQPWLLGSSIPCRDSSSSLRRHILPRRVVLVESSSRWVVLVESTSPSHPRRVIASLSRRRRVNRVSASHPRVVMVPHRVILAESSSPRRVLEWKSSRPRRVLKYRLKIRVSIYLFLSVGRKMTPFPETVSDPKSGRLWDNPGPFHASTMTHFRWYTQIKQSHI